SDAIRLRPVRCRLGRKAGVRPRNSCNGTATPVSRRARPSARDRSTRSPLSVYDQPTDPAKRRSARLTDGVDRAPARAMLKAVGFTDEDLAKPLVGVATTWIETMPCNLNQRFLAHAVKQGVRDAGGTPIEFNA